MNDKNHLDKIKDAAKESLKIPAAAAGSAYDFARGAASAGLAAGGNLAKAATDTASNLTSSLRGAREQERPEPHDVEAAPSHDVAEEEPLEPAEESESTSPSEAPSNPKPVNVTRELGLDPSPVAKRKPAKRPITKIDRAADASAVHATPADVAKVVDNDPAGDAEADE